MTIHHFYLAAGCLLWLYLLTCLCIKLLAAVHRRKSLEQKMQQIDWFLSAGHSRKYHILHLHLLQSDLSDNFLFDYMFTRYAAMQPQFNPSEQAPLHRFMQELLSRKIRLLDPADPVTRSLVIYHCVHSGLDTPVIRRFLQESENQMQAKAFAAACGKKSFSREENEVTA